MAWCESSTSPSFVEGRLTVVSSQILKEQQRHYKDLTLHMVAQICDRELDDPELTGIASARKERLFRSTLVHFETHFHKCYAAPATNDLPVLEGSAPLSAPQWSEDGRQHCFRTMASVSVNALHGGLRVIEVVGRETQGQIQRYLETVIPSLRKGLRLEEVQRVVLDQVGRLVEPSSAVVAERMQWQKRKRDLADVG